MVKHLQIFKFWTSHLPIWPKVKLKTTSRMLSKGPLIHRFLNSGKKYFVELIQNAEIYSCRPGKIRKFDFTIQEGANSN